MIAAKPLMAAALAALVSSAALAQDTATETETETETEAPAAAGEEEEAAPAAGSELAMGEEAGSDVGQPYVKEVIEDWTLQCFRTENGEEEPCQMYQLLKDDQGTAVSEFTLFRLPEGQQAVAGAMIAVPLETLLTAQITIAVDQAQAKRYPYMFCNTVGCYARVGFTEADVSAFKRGVAATVTIVPVLAPDQKVNLKLSLKGFTAAFDKVSVAPQPQ